MVILCFPIPVIKSLRINIKRKVSIIGIFWLGGFVCVSATIRFVLLYNSIYRLTDYGENQYSSITTAFIWAEIEPNTSVIAACLPTYGPLFREGGIFPKLFQSLLTALGKSKGSAHGSTPSGVSNATTVGYYELDKVISNSKTTGDIHTQRVTPNRVPAIGGAGGDGQDVRRAPKARLAR